MNTYHSRSAENETNGRPRTFSRDNGIRCQKIGQFGSKRDMVTLHMLHDILKDKACQQFNSDTHSYYERLLQILRNFYKTVPCISILNFQW